jgi:hypothetical protein
LSVSSGFVRKKTLRFNEDSKTGFAKELVEKIKEEDDSDAWFDDSEEDAADTYKDEALKEYRADTDAKISFEKDE